MVRDEAVQHGSRFGLVLVPTRGQVSDQAWRGIAGGDGDRRAGLDRTFPNSQLQQIAARLSAPFLDLVPPLRAADSQGQGPLYYERDQHWTAAGHAVAAQAIADFIRTAYGMSDETFDGPEIPLLSRVCTPCRHFRPRRSYLRRLPRP